MLPSTVNGINRNGKLCLLEICLLVFLHFFLTMLTTISLIFWGLLQQCHYLGAIDIQTLDLCLLSYSFYSYLCTVFLDLLSGPRFRPRRVPIAQYLVQVALFYLVSLLNNPYTYASGMALDLSGFLGLVQDWTYSTYIRPLSSRKQNGVITSIKEPESSPWQESMFCLHFLALPMLLPLLPDLAAKMAQLNTISPRADFSFPLPIPAFVNISSSEHHLVASSTSSPNLQPTFPIIRIPLSSINISIYIKNKSLDGPLRLFTFGLYHISISPSS
jgi:hypothetical protein